MLKNKLNQTLSGLLLAIFFVLAFTANSYSQCSYCTASTSIEDEYIDGVYIGDISNTSDWQGSVADYTSKSTDVKIGTGYSIKVTNGYAYSSDRVSVFVDWNKDCDFDDSGETITLSSSDGGETFTGTITPPSSASGGTTRMRVRMVWATTALPCGSSSYGEVEDYSLNVILPAPDAGVAEIIPPTYPYVEGNHDVSMKLGSYGDADLAEVTVHWSVNGVEQTPYSWTGTLKKDQTTQILLGSYPFIYPDGGPYGDFIIRVWLTDIVGSGTLLPDSDAGNNDKDTKTKPATEDAQPVAIVGPSGNFVPGTQDIVVQIRNNARKPLSVVDIDWYIDGTKKGSKKWFGNLNQGETANVTVGQYDFQFKTPLAPYEISATTINPNGVADPVPANDNTSTNVAPSLIAGTYTIGGDLAHFPTIGEACGYLNASGIIGDGPVIFNINNGTYNESVSLDNFSHGNNTFTFQSASGFASDVTIAGTPTAGQALFVVNGLSNVTFQNLTFNVSDGNAIAISGSNNINFNHLTISGTAGYNPIDPMYSLLYLNDVPTATFANLALNGGSNGIYTNMTDGSEPAYTFTNNSFKNYAGYGIYNDANNSVSKIKENSKDNKIQAGYGVVIENTTFTGQSTPGTGALYISSSAKITNNEFVGFVSNTTGVAVININAPTSHGTLIENNKISNAAGTTGIRANTNDAKIAHNMITIINAGSTNAYGIVSSGSNNVLNYNKINITGTDPNYYGINAASCNGGIIANNLVNANGVGAFTADYCTNLGVYYNTFATISTGDAAYLNGGNPTFMRNIVMNYGTGRSVNNAISNVNSANNNFFTKGTTNESDLTAWANVTGDNTSTNAALELTDDGTYQFVVFDERTINYTSLGIGDEYEAYDYYGNPRDGFYYIGYAGIWLDIEVIRAPQSILACNGATAQSLQVAATISYGAEAKYQWYKDGVEITGATGPIYTFPKFDYETTGNYKVKIYGPANTQDGIFTDEVLVYTLRPTEITYLTENVVAPFGGTAYLEVEAHTKGITPPLFQHKYQWYRYIDGKNVQLMDNDHYANTQSPIMTITNLQDLHFTGDNDYYFVVVEGQCGAVTSNPVKLTSASAEITFVGQPENEDVCTGSTATFSANVEVKGSETITYQWYFGETALVDDARITGATTTSLSIANTVPTDAGTYTLKVTTETGTTKTSDPAELTISIFPLFDAQPADVTVKEDETITLTVTVSGTAPFTYQWYKDDVEIAGANEATYTIEKAVLSDAGFYNCKATNVCGSSLSNAANVSVEKKGGIASVTESNPINLTVTPNPVVENINVSFEMEMNTDATISIIDITGNVVAEQTIATTMGLNSTTINLTNTIANGTYFVQIVYGNTKVAQQIVIAK